MKLNNLKTKDTVLRWHGHSCVSLAMPRTRIYIDPYQLRGQWPPASFVFITHPHFDHFDPDSLLKIYSSDTHIILPKSVSLDDTPFFEDQVIRLNPGETHRCDDRPLTFQATPAYTPERKFHPKFKNWNGYVIRTPHSSFFHAGDTGPIDLQLEAVDVGMIPVDGIYTMDASHAARWCDSLPIDRAMPIHYGTERGTITDAVTFRRGLKNSEPLSLEQVKLT